MYSISIGLIIDRHIISPLITELIVVWVDRAANFDSTSDISKLTNFKLLAELSYQGSSFSQSGKQLIVQFP
jgi:hypothetical protein